MPAGEAQLELIGGRSTGLHTLRRPLGWLDEQRSRSDEQAAIEFRALYEEGHDVLCDLPAMASKSSPNPSAALVLAETMVALDTYSR